MSSFLGVGGTYGFNLDFIKSPSSSSAYSSTLSKSSSVTSLLIPTKKPRAPRKRPNQSYIEAAILLSTAFPNVFSTKNLHKKYSGSLSSLSSSSLSSSEFPFPIFNEADFLIEEPSPEANPLKIKPVALVEESDSCVAFRDASPPGSPGYDVNSIFDDDAGEGIDSIMGKLSMDDCDSNSNSNIFPCINPFVGSPFVGSPRGLGLGGKLGIDFGVGQHIRQALRGTQSEDWLKPVVMVQMQDIVPKFNALPSLGKKNTAKKKKKVEEVKDEPGVIKTIAATGITTSPFKLLEAVKSGLGLKLNHEEVIKAWVDRGSPFSSDSGTPESSAEISARLAEIDLSPDNEGGKMRETAVQRYLEKKKARHFSNNKIRYQVRKVNANCKPRMKGRFVTKTHFLHEAIGEES